MTDDIGNGNVITVAFGVETTIKDRYSTPGFCRHHSYQLHTEPRTVRCGACKQQLDAFDILLEYARRERSWRWTEKEEREANARVNELRAEEKKIKARTKAASRKDANTAVAAERARSQQSRKRTFDHAREIAELAQRIQRATREDDIASSKEDAES